jgi:protein-L-isoaspartate(D-aspartate) O-methyltransferase
MQLANYLVHPIGAGRNRLWLFLGVAVLLVSDGHKTLGQDSDLYKRKRYKMVQEYLEREGINKESVLKAMREVPRHLFVPADKRGLAYEDFTIPMGHKQTVSPPYIVGYMTQAIDPQPEDRVLEIGTGSGYQAAVLSKIAKEVYTIEIVEPLGKEAEKRLRHLGYKNVKVKIGDGYQGWPEYAPFDKIIVTCSPENVPQPLVDQLREGGRMIIPLGERYQQMFYLLEKKGSQLVQTKLVPTLFVPMTGMAEQQRQNRPDPAHPKLVNGDFEQATDGRLDVWFYQRQASLQHDGAPQGKNYILFTNSDTGRPSEIRQAIGIDGTRVRSVALSLTVSGQGIMPGPQSFERAALVVHFYGADNMPITQHVLGPWQGTFSWRKTSAEFVVPTKTTMAIVRVGLNGATGSLGVDDIQMVPRSR